MPAPKDFDEASVAKVLRAGLDDMGLALAAGQRARLVAYLRLLHRWNRVYNLSGVRDPVQMVHRHVLDSLGLLPLLRGEALLDAGSGAGLPGLVLAIARPAMRCVLLDAAAKRVRFLIQCVAELELGNAEPVRARAQDYPGPERFPSIVSRAAFALPDLWRICRGRLDSGGRALAMRAGRPADGELAGLSARGAQCRVVAIRVPGCESLRHVVMMERAAAGGAPSPRI